MDKNEFFELVSYMQELYEKYKNRYGQELESAERRVVREEYATKSVLHRGYYCPSLVEDLVIGNSHRGRLLKRKPKETPAYQYGFNEQNQLVTIKEKFDIEFILYGNDKEIGIQYNREFEQLENVTLCKNKNGKMNLYAFCSFDSDGKVTDLYLEIYPYQRGKFYVDIYLHLALFMKMNGKGSLDFDRFIFEKENGMFTRYQTERYRDNRRVPGYWDGHFFPITIKRKCPNGDIAETEKVQAIEKIVEAGEKKSEYIMDQLQMAMEELRRNVDETSSLDEIIAAFENNCSKYQFEEEMRLYETGVFSFSGSKMFYFSLVRQFPSEEEYIQLNLSALYAPTDQNRKLKEVYWDEDLSEDFFHHIRESKAYKSVKDMKIAKVEISLDET